jgi:hypothetical protein
MQDEPTSGMTPPKPEPTVADAFKEAKEAFAAAGSVIGANVRKAVDKAESAIRKARRKAAPKKKKRAAKRKPAKKKAARKSTKKKASRKKASKKTAKKKTARKASKRKK